ncbi:MAG: 2OG-Fe(II) oxygenase [Betaproteobacteria bacterium]
MTSATEIEYEGMDDLRRAAKAGDVAATTALGTALLTGRGAPFEPIEGTALIASAVERGDVQALSVMATLRGAGAWTSQSWPEALDLLRRAAEGGADDARGQLLILAGDQALADQVRKGLAAPDVWQRLRASIDLEKWIVPEPSKQVCDWPKIYTAENFASRDLCAWLVSRGRDKFTPSMMFTGKKAVFLATRTCSDFAFTVVEGGLVLLLLRIRISLATACGVEQMEPPQIFHYATGQDIKPHYDSLYDGEHPYGSEGTYRGDRLATFLMYLNDDYDGGDLEFVKVGYTYKGKAGDGIFFASMREGKPDAQALHGARVVTRGEKFILSQWIHDRPFAAS